MSEVSEIFEVNQISDWQAVADYMLRLAAEQPLTEPDVVNASMSEAEAIARAERLMKQDGWEAKVRQYTAAVIHRITGQPQYISLVMTMEPGNIHLSAVGVMPSQVEGKPGTMYYLPDIIVKEMIDNIFGGVCEERKEGGFPQVRNFYKQLS
jgi:hypothetical protein